MSEVRDQRVKIEQLGFEEAHQILPDLIEILYDSVEGGASVGFLPPLSTEDASLYWHTVLNTVREETTLLFVAHLEDRIVGTVQIALAQKQNASHRAEVQKLLVHRSARRQGIGKLLMRAVETAAHEAKRSLLVLDTRSGDPSEQLYEKLGYIKAGVIPQYAKSTDKLLDASTFFYKLI